MAGTKARKQTKRSGSSAKPLAAGAIAKPIEFPELLSDLFINRELSWLAFNQRVLEEAMDPATPILERVKFLAIFSSNLDEFFMIRVANLKRKLTAGMGEAGPDGRTPQELAAELHRIVRGQLDTQARLLKRELLPALRSNGVDIVPVAKLSPSERDALNSQYERDIFPVLTPQAIDRGRRFPHISNQSLNLIVVLETPGIGARYARVKVPAILPRLVSLPADGCPGRFVWLEDLIATHLDHLFPGNDVVVAYPFHVIRDSDIDIDEDEDEARDLLLSMEQHLSQRTFGSVVQLIVTSAMPADVSTWLLQQMHATELELYVVDAPLALEGLFEIVRLDRPELKDPTMLPAPLARGEELDGGSEPLAWGVDDIFGAIRERDVLVHHPYQSFGVVTDFLRIAARDPNVVAIKQTLYRIGKDSPLIPALIEARDDDTQVAVLMEVKARFDEENNIAWAHELEHHGVHVAYGLAGLKTHCKLTLVVRREGDQLRRYVHLSTGNYNAGTARVYEDIGLFTANEAISSDVSELFNVLTGFSRQSDYRKLWVAPMQLRERVISAIRREIEAHQRTGKGRLIFKMNSLVDREVIRALYAASRAGVDIDLIIRGICCLRPGVPAWSETIRVRSLVGRFLEHSRIYYFANGGDDEVYLGSADLMERNLDRRVEVVFPVEDREWRQRLREVVLSAYLRDTVNSRILGSDGRYTPAMPAAGEPPFDVQSWFAESYRLA